MRHIIWILLPAKLKASIITTLNWRAHVHNQQEKNPNSFNLHFGQNISNYLSILILSNIGKLKYKTLVTTNITKYEHEDFHIVRIATDLWPRQSMVEVVFHLVVFWKT